MNNRVIAYYLGMVLRLGSACMLPPALISLYDRDLGAARGLIASAVLGLLISLGLSYSLRRRKEETREKTVYAKEGFLIVAFCWICISVFGALPYLLSGEVPNVMDCLFESVSGFTTSGSTILQEVESLPRGLLFWRSFSHWLGGMGVLTLLLAMSGNESSIRLMKAESSGPIPGKLVPRLRQSAKLLYGIYVSLTLIHIPLLLLGGMPLFDSVCCAMGTAGTGGFLTRNASMMAYDSLYLEMVTLLFMVLFGTSFNMLYLLSIRSFKAVLSSEELRVYMGILLTSTLLIAGNLFLNNVYAELGSSLRYAAFQVGAMATTTGFYSADFSQWPGFSQMLLMVIMMIGASAGSTGGGLKVARLIVLIKNARRLFVRISRPRSVGIVTLDGKTMDNQVVHSISNYYIIYTLLIVVSILVVSLDRLDFTSTVTAVLSCVGNAGPGLGAVSPGGSFSGFSALSKGVLVIGMLTGRLEIYPILLLLSPSTWRRAG